MYRIISEIHAVSPIESVTIRKTHKVHGKGEDTLHLVRMSLKRQVNQRAFMSHLGEKLQTAGFNTMTSGREHLFTCKAGREWVVRFTHPSVSEIEIYERKPGTTNEPVKIKSTEEAKIKAAARKLFRI